MKAFDTVVLYWEAAYASQYQIQYSTDGAKWNVAYSNTAGQGGAETVTFPTVQGRYVRMLGQARATAYGYSLYEVQIYNVAQCGGNGERYTVLSSSLVRDNVSGLTWQRAQTTYADQGAQYTQAIASAYCASQSMRLPTQAEALGISGTSSATCAFPLPWSTWTSTPDPLNSANAAFVTYAGQSSWQVANNFPGCVVCTSGSSVITVPTITTQPLPQTVVVGQTATFSVVASGAGTLTYQWSKNGVAIAGATSPTYTTPAATASDNGAAFSVVVTNAGGAVNSNSATLTVTGSTCSAVPSTPGTLSASANGSTQIALTWGASTAGSSCAVTYDLYRAATSGFTPTTANRIAAGLSATTYSDSGLTASTTYYYVVKAVDSVGSSPASNQATATTPGSTQTLLSQGRPATASSVENAGTPASSAVDGNTGTRWSSAFSDPQWIYVDLGATASISQVVLQWETAYGKAYQIQTSPDAITWTTIYSTTTSPGGTETLNVSGSGRYVRMYGTARAIGYGYSLWEFQVYGTPTVQDLLLSQGKPATASSVENVGTPASSAVDGNTGTRWSSAYSDPQWLQVDLGKVSTIHQVVLNWETAYGKAYQIQTSNDGTTWTTLYTASAGTGGIETLNITGSGRYVRMYGTARSTGWGYSLWEFQVYGN